MQVDNVTVKKVILQLDEEEAEWLKQIMQNPLYGDPDQEDPQDKKMRGVFWKALQGISQ